MAGGVAISVAFDESVAGLSDGAAVKLGGIKVGEVGTLTASIQNELQMPKCGWSPNSCYNLHCWVCPPVQEKRTCWISCKTRLRAVCARAWPLPGCSAPLMVELVRLEDAAPAQFDRTAEPYPELPSAPSDLPDFAATAEGAMYGSANCPSKS